MTKAEKYVNNWSYQTFYEAVLCPAPEALRFRVRRAFGNPVIAECNYKGQLRIRKLLVLTQEETCQLNEWIKQVFIEAD